MEEFRTFKSEVEAEDLAAWLCRRGIHAEVRNIAPRFDPSFANSVLSRGWAVELDASDFSRASESLHHFFDQRLSAVPPDYYLFGFSDAELYEILQKPDEWGDLDHALAGALLKERGLEFDAEDVRQLRAKRYTQLAEPDTILGSGWLIFGYLLSLTGLLGALNGWYLEHGQKLLPDGRKVPRYTASVRKHGRYMFAIGVIATVILSFVILRIQYWKGLFG